MFWIPLKEWTIERVQARIDGGWYEGAQTDFKRSVPGPGQESKLDFLHDVTAFANSGGGDLIFGVEEDRQRGVAKGIVGLDGDNLDEVQRRLTDWMRGGDVQPPVVAHAFHIVQGAALVLVLRILPSPIGPHWVTTGKHRGYHIRSGNKVAHMSHEELRAAFHRDGDRARELMRWREQRVAMPWMRTHDASNGTGATMFVHFMPLLPQTIQIPEDIQVSAPWPIRYLQMARWNLDGWYAQDAGMEAIQLFRNGALEHRYLVPRTDNGLSVHAGVFNARTLFSNQTRLLRACGVVGPISMAWSLAGVLDLRLYHPEHWAREFLADRQFFDRDTILLPDTMLPEPFGDGDKEIRFQADMLWQSGGARRCWCWHEDGRWDTSYNR